MTQIVSDLENNHTGRKLPTMAKLGFLIGNFFSLLSGFLYIPYIFGGHAHTELGVPVVVLMS